MILRHVALPVSILIFGIVSITWAQEAEPTARLRALNEAVLRHRELARTAGPNQLSGIRSQAANDIRRREAALAVLIETDPATALKMAFAPDLLDSTRAVFPESADRFEKQGTWTGVIESTVEDDADQNNSKVIHLLKAEGVSRPLYFGGRGEIASNGRVVVTGIEAGGNIAAASISSPAAVAAATGSGTIGAQRIVAILVNLPGYRLPANVDAEFIKGVMFGNAWSAKQNSPDWNVDDFWQQNSDGQTSAPFSAGKVVGPYQLSSNFNTDASGSVFCDYSGMKQAVIGAADASVNFSLFNRVVIVMPNNGACTWSGVSGIGYWSANSLDGAFTASFSWLRADQLPTRAAGVQLAAHELGHGFGMNHARSRDYSDSVRRPLGAIGASGVLNEYGDSFSVMGTGNTGFYSAQHSQEVLGWLTPANNTVVQTSGHYTLHAYEARGAASLVKALKVLRDPTSNAWLWIEYRTSSGLYDSSLNSQVWSGALIHYEDPSTGGYTDLLDFTPSTTSFSDPALAAGQTWIDPYSNLSITIGSIGSDSSGSILNVELKYGAANCLPANPSVTLSPANPTVNPGGSISFTVTVTNHNSSTCPLSTYSLTAMQHSGFSGKFSATSLILAGGATGSTTLTETAGASIGTFPVSATATDTSTPGSSGTGTANVTTASLCVSANPLITLSPATVSLKTGGATALTLTLKNNNSAGCAAASWNFTAVQPKGFSDTFSKTSLSNIASGASSSITLTEKAGTTVGTFTLSVTATNNTSPASKATATAAITVTHSSTLTH